MNTGGSILDVWISFLDVVHLNLDVAIRLFRAGALYELGSWAGAGAGLKKFFEKIFQKLLTKSQ